ncbi:hypothetical protein E2C01_037021 [Portunus trituberculatus]|uniref:Uncharacterized protein n=1 Tax=Portunus trituberculatus TaxID=210409 RepID=A0A5B7FD04_PORTR|nr:hypothetical protein [Portunus trituberculatus]
MFSVQHPAISFILSKVVLSAPSIRTPAGDADELSENTALKNKSITCEWSISPPSGHTSFPEEPMSAPTRPPLLTSGQSWSGFID